MKFTSTENSYAGIHGLTIIDHRILAKLGITMLGYTVMDLIYRSEKEGTPLTEEYIWRAIGLRGPDFVMICSDLAERKLLNMEGKNVSKMWRDEFEKEDEKENEKNFEKFWDLYGHIGGKEDARRAFTKAMKIISMPHLVEMNGIYEAHLSKETWKKKMHLSTWLNPEKKRYDDEYVEKERKEAPKKLSTKW